MDKIFIFISVDKQSLGDYFNPHDPAPIYKRQLSHAFEQYIMNSIVSVKRHSVFNYKICSKSEDDKQYTEPLIYAIRRHFAEKKLLKESEFEKFKRRSYLLLFFSLSVVTLFQVLLPMVLNGPNHINAGISNTLEVFSWVILWRPIDELIFNWNPYLKDISIMNRLSIAEVIVIDHS
jgi:hypothetical protein